MSRGARHELADIKSCHGDREQTHRRENREASTHVVGDDERLVALLVGSRTGRTLVGVGDGDDHVLGRLLAPLGLTLLLQQAESEGRLRGRAALGDIDHAKALTLQIGGQFVEVVLANVVAGKEDDRVAVVADQPRETIAQGPQ